jgi:D-alanyl-D-alanine carboxypeptidase/D-alanyl-D-alanine-endopeptidase (penicillin-binding protein 4)
MMSMHRRLFLIPVLLLAACGASSAAPQEAKPDAPPPVAPPPAPKPVAPPPPAVPIVTTKLAAAVVTKQSKSLRASVGVYDAATGDTLYEANGAATRRPASVMKVATTAAALLTLGAKGELATEVFATAKPDAEGRVDGDLVVKGGGDPGFNNREGYGKATTPGQAEAALHEMAKAVRTSGVRKVTGGLQLDDSAFTGAMRHPGWNWGDGQWSWDTAPVASILLTDSCVELTVLPGADGAAASIATDPPTQAVRFVNKVVTAAAGAKDTKVVLGRSDGAGTIPVSGNVPAKTAGYRINAACVDPAEHFGDVFLRVLREEGVEVAGRATVLRLPEGAVASHDGAPLVRVARHATNVLDVVRVANKHSQNLYAEILLRATGRAVAGDGSFEGGCAATRVALGFAPNDATFAQVDGSGFARENQVTVGAMGKILVKMFNSPAARDFISTLPGAAEPYSTLRKRLRESKFDGHVFAKTGTLHDTSSLAGYVRGQSGRTYVFVVLCEGENGRAHELQDDVVEALVGQ